MQPIRRNQENKVNVNLIYLLKLIKALVSDALIIW